MNKLVLVSESPNKAKKLATALSALNLNSIITIIHTSCGSYKGPVVFDTPKHIKWAEFPYVSAPTYKVTLNYSWHAVQVAPDGGVINISDAEAEADLKSADEIWFGTDPDVHGEMLAYLMVEKIIGKKDIGRCKRITTRDFSEEALSQALTSPLPYETSSSSVLYGLTKHYFDWNFNLNSLAVIGKTLRLAGCSKNVFLSKYAMLSLYILDREPLAAGKLAQQLQNWKGTGKYTERCGVSPVSMATIIDYLLSTHLVLKNTDSQMELSNTGKKVLRFLHPDCCDLDLPFRLEFWCSKGLSASRMEIDRYIRTFFGKQKRFLGRHGE